ncbi:hypothetical protein QN277_025541 [Acacia crassicarpa]|uniref:Uncharacterized protein n=1 Tax=Acacia crassicarpa TaxID=499986 RepID=A0AAE1J8Q7_9FABA|nr:hypothetical protein QN277_025541 [Acacia crassicarpa]
MGKFKILIGATARNMKMHLLRVQSFLDSRVLGPGSSGFGVRWVDSTNIRRGNMIAIVCAAAEKDGNGPREGRSMSQSPSQKQSQNPTSSIPSLPYSYALLK